MELHRELISFEGYFSRDEILGSISRLVRLVIPLRVKSVGFVPD